MAEKTCRFPSLTRRSFMKGAAAVAAGAGMLGTGSWLAATEAKAAETDDEIVRYCWHKGHCAGYCSGTVKNLAHFSDSLISPPSGAATPPAESRPDSASSPTRSRPRT